MVGPPDTGEDGAVPEPVTVWMVKLRRGGDLREVKGTLLMGEDALVFVERKTEVETRLLFSDTSKVKRVIGSQVLVVRCDGADADADIAFYFVQPPPLPGVESHAPPPTSVFHQPSRRRQRRQGVGYLTGRARVTRTTIKEWVEELRART